MHSFTKHHRLLALLLSMLLLVGMIPMTAISTAAAEADVAEDAAPAEEVADLAAETEELADVGAKLDAAATGVDYTTSIGISAPFGVTVSTAAQYPWTVADAENGVLASGNKGIHSSKSYMKITAYAAGTLSFKYFNSSESSDRLYYLKSNLTGIDASSTSGNTSVSGVTTVNSLSDVTSWNSSGNITLASGESVYFAKTKDGSVSRGADTAWVKDIQFTTTETPESLGLPTGTINFVVVGDYPDGDFYLSETPGGTQASSVSGYQYSSKKMYSVHPEDYDVTNVYSDAACTNLVASGETPSFLFSSSVDTYYVKFSMNWLPVEGYTDPANLTVKTLSTRGRMWTSDTEDDTPVLKSGLGAVNGGVKNASYMKVTVKETGVLYFKWYFESVSYNNFTYCINGVVGEPDISGKPFLNKPNAWYDVAIPVQKNDIVMFTYGNLDSYNKDLATLGKVGKVKDLYLDTDPNEVTINFVCSEGEGFISTAKNTNPANKVEAKTGYTDTAAGVFYAVPNLEEGYSFVGLYTTPDFQAGTEVAHDYHSTATYYSRKFTMNFPAEDVTYYAKFQKANSLNYLVRFDESIVKNVSYTITTNGDGSSLEGIDIYNAQPVKLEHDSQYIVCYPGDIVRINYMIQDTTKNGDLGVTLDGDPLIASSGGTFVAGKVAADLYVLNINTSTIGYVPVEGFTASHAAVYTNVEYKMPDGYKNYPWISTDNVLTPLNHNVNAKCYAFLKIVPDRTGTLKFTYKISSETNYDYLAYKSGTEPYPYNGGGTGNTRNAAGYSGYGTAAIPWTEFTVDVTKDVPFYISYSKDSGIRGDDCLWIKNVYVASGDMDYTIQAYDDQGYILEPNNTVGLINYSVDNTSGEEAVNVSGGSDQVNKSFQAEAGLAVTLTAAQQPDGQFLRWVTVDPDTGDETFYSSDPVISFIATDSLNFRAVFTDEIDDEDAVALLGSAKYGDVAEAINSAVPGETVVLLEGEPELGEDVTVKSGVTVLIPFDDDHSLYTSHLDKKEYTGGATEGYSSDQIPKDANAYCKLIIPDGIKLIIEDGGVVSVSALNVAGHNNNNLMGPVAGAYGQIELEGDIIVKDGGSLYAWGFITGSGKVTAKSGADVYEYFQIYDFRGGTITANMYFSGTNQFPFNQYYVQNIESEIVFEYGSTQYVNMALYAGGTITVAQAEFVGDNGVFVLNGEDSYLDRWYDAPNDKMHYDIYGGAEIEDISLTVMITFSSSDYYLPINNIDITLKDGSTLDLDKRIVFLPGSSLTVDDGATLNIENGASVIFVGDSEGIDKYSASGASLLPPAHPVAFAASEDWEPRLTLGSSCSNDASKAAMRQYVADNPATLNNNGTVIVENGAALASTVDDANIYSESGNGTFIINGSNTISTGLQRYVDTDHMKEVIPNESAVLQNNGESAGTQTTTTDRWSDSIAAIYTMQNNVWGDWRTVTFCDAEGNPVAEPVANVNLADKSDIHDFDGDVAWSGFDDEGKYWKYVENGDWTYEYLTPGVAGTETQLKALPINGTKTTVFEKHSLTLNGDVGVNFYLFDAPAGATVSYSWGNKYISDNNYSADESYTATSGIADDEDTGYKLASVSVAPKEMGDEITVNMMLNGNVIATETYSAATYLNTIINDRDKALAVCENSSTKADALQALCTSMLQYGAACQNQFGYKTGNLVSDSYEFVSPDLSGLTAAYETDYPATGDGRIPNFTFMGYMMTLDSESVLNLVFRNDTADEYPEFTVTGATAERMSEGKYYRFDVSGIKINELLTDRVVKINDADMTVNAGTYIYKALQFADSNVKILMKNLYNYYQKATAYFAFG